MSKIVEKINLEGAKLLYRNFAGEKGKYNTNGEKGFNVIIEDENYAQDLIAEGWNVKIRVPRDEGDTPIYHLPVAVNYNNKPPHIVLVTSRNKTLLDDSTVSILDGADIQTIDLIINPRIWGDDNEKIKAYVKVMYVTIEEDVFAHKYE